jgi:opacity protein-like surface antigen
MMRFRTAVLAVALLGLSVLTAEAQVELHKWQLVVGGGYQTYASGAAMQDGGSLNGEANYFISEMLGIGLYTDFTFTESDGSQLIPTELNFMDSTTFTIPNQPMEIWQYGVQGKLRLPSSTSPFLLAGVGGYTVFLDPQQNDGFTNDTRWMLKFGAGVDFAVSPAAGFQLAVQDNFYPNWNPNALQPAREQFQNTQFPELNPDQSDLSSSVHNFKFLVSLTLLPGAL